MDELRQIVDVAALRRDRTFERIRRVHRARTGRLRSGLRCSVPDESDTSDQTVPDFIDRHVLGLFVPVHHCFMIDYVAILCD